MSIKRFCDCCEREMERNYVADRLKGSYVHMNKKVQYEVLLGVGSAWNTGDLCATCLKDIIGAVLGVVSR